MSARPVYRYAPKSHAGNCRCERCAPFYKQRNDPMMGGLGILIIMFILAGVIAGIGALITGVAHHPVQAGEIAGGIAAFALFVFCLAALNRRELNRPPKGRLHVEATVPGSVPPFSSLPPGPWQPPCLHLNAVKVDTSFFGETTVHFCWCPDCDPDCKTPLPANFRRSCCGTEPETRHLGNCPHAPEGTT